MPGASFEETPALFDELKSYLGLTGEDSRVLREMGALAKPALPAVADEFYAIIRVHPGAFAVLKDEAQARRLHATLQVWLGELFSGNYDREYYARRCRIGQAHVRVGLAQHYMVTAMGRIRTSLQALAGKLFPDDPVKEAACRVAIARVCDIDLAIMLDSYRRDLAVRLERIQQLEKDALELRLTERKRFLDEALQVADVAVLGFDARGRLVFFNRKAEALTGYANDEVVDIDPFERFFGDRYEAVRALFLSAKDGAPVAIEEDLRTRAGRVRRVTWRAASYRADGAEAPTVVVVGMDVTEQRDLERRARQSERLATAGVLAAGLAHEIRNPLNGASLHLSVLERALARASNVPSDAPEAVDVVRTEIRRLSSLVTDFLEVARPRPLSVGEYDLNPVVQSIATLLAPEVAQRDVALRVEPCPIPPIGKFDAERIKQVLLNLVRNALEAVEEKGEVIIRVRRTPQFLEVDVEDDGPGFQQTAPIFDAFYTTKERGTGLGLSIVNRIVTDHDGDVRFTTEPGCTVFTVRLPIEA
jgi:PAS domain S-box-containing protein